MMVPRYSGTRAGTRSRIHNHYRFRGLSHGIPHIECGCPHVATVAVAWGGVETMRALGVCDGLLSRYPAPR